jgi:cell division protein FtsB
MDEKKFNVVLEALAEVIDDLRFKVRLLQNENERLKKENDILRKDNVALTRELRGECVFKKIERFDENDD